PAGTGSGRSAAAPPTKPGCESLRWASAAASIDRTRCDSAWDAGCAPAGACVATMLDQAKPVHWAAGRPVHEVDLSPCCSPFDFRWRASSPSSTRHSQRQKNVRAAIIKLVLRARLVSRSLTECSTHKRENRGDGREENARSKSSSNHQPVRMPRTDEI